METIVVISIIMLIIIGDNVNKKFKNLEEKIEDLKIDVVDIRDDVREISDVVVPSDIPDQP